MPINPWQDNPDYAVHELTIANGTQTSTAAADLKNGTLCGILIPSPFTGTSVSFLVREDEVDYAVHDGAGALYEVTVAAGVFVPVDSSKFIAVRHLKVRSGSAEGGARTVKLVTRKL